MKDMQVQLIRPPVPIRQGPSRRVSLGSGRFGRHRARATGLSVFFYRFGGLRLLVFSGGRAILGEHGRGDAQHHEAGNYTSEVS